MDIILASVISVIITACWMVVMVLIVNYFNKRDKEMSDSQKREAKRLVEILIAMGCIEEDLEAHPMEVVTYFTMKFQTIKEWITVFTEAISTYQSEKIGNGDGR